MFNTKLSITRKMKRLRICVLVSVCPSGNVTLFSALFPTMALTGSGRTFRTRGVTRVSVIGPGINLLPVFLVVRRFPLSMFQRVLPVTCSISPRMILESCALNAGLPIGFSVENPRGHQVGRMGKAVVMVMMMICTWKLHKSSLDHVTWAPKLGSPVATATSAVITRAGVVVPLLLLPPLPLPRPCHLGSVVARMLHPLVGTLQCTDVGSTVGRFFGDFNK